MLKVLINPLAQGAYFSSLLKVAQAELSALFPGVEAAPSRCGPLQFIDVALPRSEARQLMRLSFAQGLFEEAPNGQLTPLAEGPGFALPEALVWGSKYRGKTHELVTQLSEQTSPMYDPPRIPHLDNDNWREVL